jgi:hypothetical protein
MKTHIAAVFALSMSILCAASLSGCASEQTVVDQPPPTGYIPPKNSSTESILADIDKTNAQFAQNNGLNEIEVRPEWSKEIEKRGPEHVFKMKYCQNPNLYSAFYYSQSIEPKCIYILHGRAAQMSVIQSVKGGILVSVNLQRLIFIKTKKQYADGDAIDEQFVRSVGLLQYDNAIGAQKTVNSFESLGNAEFDPESQEIDAWKDRPDAVVRVGAPKN